MKDYHINNSLSCDGETNISALASCSSNGQTGTVTATRSTDCPNGFSSENWTISINGEVLVNQATEGALPTSITPTTGPFAGIEVFISENPDFKNLEFSVSTGFEGTLIIAVLYSTTNACGDSATSSCTVSLTWAGPTAVPEIVTQVDNTFDLTGINSLDGNCPSGITSYSWSFLGLVEGVDYSYLNGTSASSIAPEVNFTNLGTYTAQLTVTTACGQDTSNLVLSVASSNTTIANDDNFTALGMIADGTVYNVDPLANDTDPEGDGQIITAINGTAISPGDTIVAAAITFVMQVDYTLNVSTNTPLTNQSITYTVRDDNAFPATDTAQMLFTFAAINAPTIATNPLPDTTCEGGPVAVFTGAANAGNGGTIAYQWQVSNNGGASYTNIIDDANYSGTATDTLTVQSNFALDGRLYRFRATESPSGLTATSTGALLDIVPIITNISGPNNANVNSGAAAIFSVTHSIVEGTASYQWYESTDGGTIYNPISNGGDYSGATSISLTVQNPDASKTGNLYRVEITDNVNNAGGSVGCTVTSPAATLTVTVNTTIANDDNYTEANGFTNYEGLTYTYNLLGNDTDPEGDDQTITQFNGQAVSVGPTYNLSDGRGTFELLPSGQIQITWAEGSEGTGISYTYEVTDDNIAPATDTATATFDILNVSAIVFQTGVEPGGTVRADGSGNANTYVSVAWDQSPIDGTFDSEIALPLSVGPAGVGANYDTGAIAFGVGDVIVTQVWGDANRTTGIIDQDRKQFPTPISVNNCGTQSALNFTASNGSQDSVANTYTAGNYSSANDLFFSTLIFNTLTDGSTTVNNKGLPLLNTVSTPPVAGTPVDAAFMQTSFEASGFDPADAAIMAAAITGTVDNITVDGDVFADSYGTTQISHRLSVTHQYTDGTDLTSLTATGGQVTTSCAIAPTAPPPTVAIVWDGSKTNPENTSMTISGLLGDGVTPHDGTITYDVTIETYLGSHTVNGVQWGTAIPGGEVANILSNTGVNIISGNVENFSYQHPAQNIPTPTRGANDELEAGFEPVIEGVRITVIANEGAQSSASDNDNSYFYSYIFENGESSGNSGLSPWVPNGEDGVPTLLGGYWYVQGETGPGTSPAVPVGPSSAYIFELDNNNHGGGGGPFSHNQYFMFVHGVNDLELEIDGVFVDIGVGSGGGSFILGDSEFVAAIDWAESQALGSNGATHVIGSVNGNFVETGDPESLLSGQNMPGTIGGVNYGTTASGSWGGWYELQYTQADFGNMRMQDPATLETVIWVPAKFVR